MSSTGTCPRCDVALAPGYGALGEDVCPSCDGRLLSPELTRRVVIDEGGTDPDTVRQLAEHFGGERLPCPACAGEMSPVTLKGTPIDVCLRCGATFLDAGELARLSGGAHAEAILPPSQIRPADHAVEQADAPVDARATWEKALPMYALESLAVFGWLSHVRPTWTGMHVLGATLGLVALPLGLSMLADTDLRGFGRRRRGFALGGRGFRGGGMAGVFLGFVAIVIGGLISTANAILAERLPKKIARAVTWGSLAALVAWALIKTVA